MTTLLILLVCTTAVWAMFETTRDKPDDAQLVSDDMMNHQGAKGFEPRLQSPTGLGNPNEAGTPQVAKTENDTPVSC